MQMLRKKGRGNKLEFISYIPTILNLMLGFIKQILNI